MTSFGELLLTKALRLGRVRAYRKHGNIVLHKYMAIYFFIPKNASSTIKSICRDLLEIRPSDFARPELFVHEVDYPCVRRGEISAYANYYKFAIVRNPYSRLVSCYKEKILSYSRTDTWFKNGVARNLLKWDKEFYCNMAFEEFVYAVCRIPDKAADVHFKSQYLFLPVSEGRVLVDFIGKFENLEADLRTVFVSLNISPVQLPHLLNTGLGSSYEDYYNETLVEMVNERYKKDLEIFGYDF